MTLIDSKSPEDLSTSGLVNYLTDIQALGFSPVTTSRPGIAAPYFLDTQLLNDGNNLSVIKYFLAKFVVDLEHHYGIKYDYIIGVSYSGQTLATSLSIAMAEEYDRICKVRFDRKTPAYPGEKPLTQKVGGNVLIVDDMISSGETLRRIIEICKMYQCTKITSLVMLDRQEPGKIFKTQSGLKELEHVTQTDVHAMIKLSDILKEIDGTEHFNSLMLYMRNHCVVY